MVVTVAVSDKDPLTRGGSFECRLVKATQGKPCATCNGCEAAGYIRVPADSGVRSPRTGYSAVADSSAVVAGQLA